MNNKLLKTMLIIVVVIALAGGGAIFYLLQQNNANKGPNIDDILKYSVDITDFTTNLASNNYIKMSLKIETNSKSAAEELTKREFQVRNILVEELSDTKAEDLQGKVGKVKLEGTLKKRISEVMKDGKVVKVYITDSLLQ